MTNKERNPINRTEAKKHKIKNVMTTTKMTRMTRITKQADVEERRALSD
jgi:hypothetical protein